MLDSDLCTKLLTIMLDKGADISDIYAEESYANGASSDDQKINTSASSQSGVGLRAVKDYNTYYMVVQDATPDSLEDAARYLSSGMVLQSDSPKPPTILTMGKTHDHLENVKISPTDVAISDKVELVREAQDSAWGYSDQVKQVTIYYSDMFRKIQLASSVHGTLETQILGLLEFSIIVYAGENSERQMGRAGRSFTQGMEAFSGDNSPSALANKACEQAITMLSARECPRSEMPVVFAPGENGILFHESCGHGMEADLVEKGSSFANLLGETVAIPKVTIHDSGLLPGYPGSFAVDDEGVPAQDTVLIDQGRLTSYLHSLITAGKFGQNPTGSGRRQSFKHAPMPRMRNTFIAAGPDDPEEIIKGTKLGLYASDVGFGGQVDVVTGKFITSILLGYMIEDGRITYPVKGATITGTGLQALKDIDMVGSDLIMCHASGRCGKGQDVPVGVGMPTVRVKSLTVGGTGPSIQGHHV